MSVLVGKLFETYNYLNYELADPRTNDWFLMSNPLPILCIVSTYLYFCKSYGPRFMKTRQPYDLKYVVMVYNIMQICMSALILREGCAYVFSREYNIACEPVDYSTKPRALRLAGATWWYFFSKVTELLDTVFFIMRKKYNQVSFLHVYHHTIMVLFMWYGTKYFAGGHLVIMGLLNSFVHVVMYTYYLISGLGPKYQKYLWWKKHITHLQLIQFVIVFCHNFAVFFYKCNYPKFINVMSCFNSMIFIYLFGKFYIKSYTMEHNDVKKNGFKNGTKAY